jgi:hypothetical protein
MVALASFVALQAAPVRADLEDKRKATKLLKQARKLMKKRTYNEAVLVLIKARELDNRPEINFEIARAYEGLFSSVEAAQIYEELSTRGELPANKLRFCRERLQTLRKQLGRIKIESRKDAEIEVNGVEVGETPIQGVIYVKPGEVKIVAETEDRKVRLTRDVRAGQIKTIKISWKKKHRSRRRYTTPPPVTGTTPTPRRDRYDDYADEDDEDERPAPAARVRRTRMVRVKKEGWLLGRTWTWVAAGSALATGIVGMGVGIAAAVEYGDYKDEQDSSKWPDMESSIKTKSTVANVFFGIAGAAAVTAVILYFVEGGTEERPAPAGGRRSARKWTLTGGPTAAGGGGQVSFGMQF